MNSFFFSLAMFWTARPTADTGTSTIRSTWSTSYQRRAMPPPMSGLSWWSPTMMLIGLPSTLPPKSSIAICAAVAEPWPVGGDAGPVLSGVAPVGPVELTLFEALRCMAADMPPLEAHPRRGVAALDRYAFGARDLVGVWSYSPLPLTTSPVWVEAGEAMPDGCDCVLDSDSVDLSGPLPQVLAEAIPGQGVRRAGGDIAAGSLVAEAGRRVLPRDLLMARAAGIARLNVRRPRLGVVNVPGGAVTADLIAESARAAGAEIVSSTAAGRDAESIAAALGDGAYDLLLTVGGSGVGRTDTAVTALAARGEVFAHGIALQPGRTSAVGRLGKTPVVVVPGAPDQALAAWCTLALPVL